MNLVMERLALQMLVLVGLLGLGSSEQPPNRQILVNKVGHSLELRYSSIRLREGTSPSRILQANDNVTYHPFIIQADYSLSKAIDSQMLAFLDEAIIKPISSLFRDAIEVHGDKFLPPFDEAGCFVASALPDRYKQNSTNCDLLLFVSVQQLDENINAKATSCGLDSKTGRPLIGHMIINKSYLEMSYFKIEKIKSSVIHELLHILAFEVELFTNLPNAKSFGYRNVLQKDAQSPETYFIVAPEVIEFARSHFNCSSMTGISMEDDGGIHSRNSHFEKALAGNEIMTAQSEGRQILSGLTLAFLSSTGWYKVNRSAAEYWSYGRHKGCFWEGSKNSTGELWNCSELQMYRCSDDLLSKTLCVQSIFNDNTAQFFPLETLRCSHQLDFTSTSPLELPSRFSRCMETEFNSKKSSGCYPVQCVDGAVSVFVKDETLVCSHSGQILKFKEVQVRCEDYAKICQTPKCPNDCNGNGVCLENGKCKCHLFFSGDSCEKIDNCTLSDSLCSILYLDFGKTLSLLDDELPLAFKPAVKTEGFVASKASNSPRVNRGILISNSSSSYESQVSYAPGSVDVSQTTNNTDSSNRPASTSSVPRSQASANTEPQMSATPIIQTQITQTQSRMSSSASPETESSPANSNGTSPPKKSEPLIQSNSFSSPEVEQRVANDSSDKAADLSKNTTSQEPTLSSVFRLQLILTIVLSAFY